MTDPRLSKVRRRCSCAVIPAQAAIDQGRTAASALAVCTPSTSPGLCAPARAGSPRHRFTCAALPGPSGLHGSLPHTHNSDDAEPHYALPAACANSIGSPGPPEARSCSSVLQAPPPMASWACPAAGGQGSPPDAGMATTSRLLGGAPQDRHPSPTSLIFQENSSEFFHVVFSVWGHFSEGWGLLGFDEWCMMMTGRRTMGQMSFWYAPYEPHHTPDVGTNVATLIPNPLHRSSPHAAVRACQVLQTLAEALPGCAHGGMDLAGRAGASKERYLYRLRTPSVRIRCRAICRPFMRCCGGSSAAAAWPLPPAWAAPAPTIEREAHHT